MNSDLNNNLKPNINYTKVLKSFFNTLKESDFTSDTLLSEFYKEYKSNCNTTLLDFYISYVSNNANSDNDTKKQTDSLTNNAFLQKDIACAILSKSMQDTNLNSHIQTSKVAISKKYAMTILSDFIKQSRMMVYQEIDENPTDEDEKFRNNTTNIITEEILADSGNIPIPKKDNRFNQRNALLNIWQDTEHKCMQFLQNKEFSAYLKKALFIDGKDVYTACNDNIQQLLTQANSASQQTKQVTISTINMEEISHVIPSEPLTSKLTWLTYQPNVQLSKQHYLTEVLNTTSASSKTLLIASGSRMILGGGADQGIETNEMYLYYATSYSIGLSTFSNVYPLTNSQFIYLPNTLVFKDHTDVFYSMLPHDKSKKIAVLNATPMYKPDTLINSSIDTSQSSTINSNHALHSIDISLCPMDINLYQKNVKYKNTDDIINQLHYIFQTALFLGYDTLIFDDRGVEDFWAPVHHTAQLLSQLINCYKTLFKKITVAIHKPHIYDIFKGYI